MHKSGLNNRLALITVIWIMLLFAGCRSAKITEPESKPIFFPPPPETPRLQFLKSFSGPEDLGIVTTSVFEKFVVGEPERVEGIKAPYGLAIHEGKIYVCDVGRGLVEVIDPRNRTFDYLTKDRRLMNPVNIYIDDDGTKYIADPKAGMVFVFDRNNNIRTMLGKELRINPIDVVVRGSLCYVTDYSSNQIVIMDRTTGREITRIGKKSEGGQGRAEPLTALINGEFSLISDLALDLQGNIYVTDKAGARITQFDRSGVFRRTIGRLGDNIDEFIRPKGIAIDNNDRIWVVDSGTEVAKIYNQQAQLLLFFGLPGNEPGMMNMPTSIVLDYDNIELFEQYAVEGADIEFLVLVSNQYGPNKVSVYGFGSFPVNGKMIEKSREFVRSTESTFEQQQISQPPAFETPTTPKTQAQPRDRQREISELYNRSMTLYNAGQLETARGGFLELLNSGLLPPNMITTIQGYVADINSTLATDEQKQQIAELYYSSMAFYRAGNLEKARDGLTRVLRSGLIPPAMAKTIEKYLADINKTLNKR